MQKFYFLVMLLMGLTLPVLAQNGIIGQGFANGFSNPADIGFFDDSFGDSRIRITQSTGTGNQFFRMVRAWSGDNTEFAPQATCPANDQDVTSLSGDVLDGVVSFGNCDKAFFIDVPNTTDNYVFKTPSPTATMEFIYFRIEGPIASIILTQQMPSINGAGEVPANMDVQIASLADINVPTGQGVYLRYTTDGFATSTVIPMTVLCVSGNCTPFATIPGQPDGTTITYYVFTSGDAVLPAVDGSDADYRTINADTNGGANFSYTTSSALPVTYASFTGHREKADVVDLAWSTATEDQAGFFTVECSIDDGRIWMVRATVAAQNRPNGASYSFTDHGAPSTDLSYRLRQTDVDGSFQFSNIVPVPALQTIVRIWPQPAAGDRVNVSIPDQYLGGNATLMNTIGRKLSTFALNAAREEFNVGDLPAGMYLLQLSAPGGEQTVRRVLVR
ncbi:MAG: T9SS type A sorting domain-containing protein [Lewinella sp.]